MTTRWIPGHQEIPGNNIAHQAAREFLLSPISDHDSQCKHKTTKTLNAPQDDDVDDGIQDNPDSEKAQMIARA